MIIAWIGYCLLVSALLGLAALGAERALGHYRRPVRAVWAAGLVGSLLLPIAAYVAPTLVSRFATVTDVLPLGIPAAIALDELTVAPASGFDWTAFASTVGVGLGALWLISIGAFGVYLASVHRRLRREMAGWTPGQILDAPVMLSRDRGPAVVGMGRGVIVMPAWISDLEEDVLRLVFLHEREHQLAGDNRLFSVGLFAVAAMPWNPVAWWQLRRLRLAIEFDCDRRVMAHGIAPREYAEALLAVGSRLTSAPLAAFAFAERQPAVERRLRRMTEPLRRLRGPRALLAVGLSTLAVMVACGSPLPMNAPATADPDLSGAPNVDEQTSTKVIPDEGQAPQFIAYDTPPILQNRAEMSDAIDEHYPADAREENLGGRTELWMFIDDEGDVLNLEVKTSSGDMRFDKAAIEVMKNAAFAPAENQGVKTGVWVSQWVTFQDGDDTEMIESEQLMQVPPDQSPTDGTAPLYVVDGVIMAAGQTTIDRNEVESVEVIKGEAASSMYGERAANGVVQITTKTGGVVRPRPDQADTVRPDQADAGAPGQAATDARPPSGQNVSGIVSRNGKVGGPMNASGRSESPLIVIDGEIQDGGATLADVGALDIDHVEIVKGEAAQLLYGERGKNGVIQITTKAWVEANPNAEQRPLPDIAPADRATDLLPKVSGVVVSAREAACRNPNSEWYESPDCPEPERVTLTGDVSLEWGDDVGPRLEPLVVIDGVIQSAAVDKAMMESLDIDSVEVVKGQAARVMYGERARNGVILIKTKGGGR